MIRALAEFAITSLNQLPAPNGVSPYLSPTTIMTGAQTLDFRKLKLEIGEYAQVFEANDPTNTNKERNTGAITLNQSGSDEGGYHFMSLVTGRRLARKQWTKLPMPDWVIQYVEDIAKVEDQKELNGGKPLWEWRPGVAIEPIIDIDVDSDDEYFNDPHDRDIFNINQRRNLNANAPEFEPINDHPVEANDDGVFNLVDDINPQQNPVDDTAIISDEDISQDDNPSSPSDGSPDEDFSFNELSSDSDLSYDSNDDASSNTPTTENTVTFEEIDSSISPVDASAQRSVLASGTTDTETHHHNTSRSDQECSTRSKHDTPETDINASASTANLPEPILRRSKRNPKPNF